MEISLLIRRRLRDLALEQRDLAAASGVTESYISQLLTRKKAPPAPERTDIYEKMERLLKLPGGQLSKLAELQRREEWKKKLADPPPPLYKGVRDLILRKCRPERRAEIRGVFEKEPFGPVERIVTERLLDVVKRIAREELESENWLRIVARLSGSSYEQTRVRVLEFLDTDIFSLSDDNCATFLDPLIESWDIDLVTFGIEIVLNHRLASGPRKFELMERSPDEDQQEAGLAEFLRDQQLSAGTSIEEVEFLKKLRFNGRRPTPLYYYRELQNLRDPLHFRSSNAQGEKGTMRPRRSGLRAARKLRRA